MNLSLIESCIELIELGAFATKEDIAKALKSSIKLTKEQGKPLTREEYEKIMKQWDYWRKQIANGDKSSAPRDWFEGILEMIIEGGGIK